MLPVRLLALLVILALGPAPLAVAQTDEAATRAELERLQGEIKRLSSRIAQDTSRKNTLQNQLRDAEISLGKLQKKIADNQRALAQSQAQLTDLNKRQATLNKSRDKQQGLIAREMRTAYQMGRQGQLKVLLNQEDPNTLARALTYYRYFFEARSEHIDKYRAILVELDELKPTIIALSSQLKKTSQALSQQQQTLISATQTREDAVAQLLASIRSQGGQLKQMEQDQRELEQLLEAIEQAVAKLKMPSNYKAFAAAKGTMPWPVPGRASHRFGNARAGGKMRWQGVTIPAKAGTQVKAIHHGRVVYADWLRGSGLLLIIDHGDGYMSLYAHNQSLLREVGEWVSADSAIGTVGSSGGRDNSAVYFEIRYKGKPTNPARWCRR